MEDVRNAVAGGLAGIAVDAVLFPLDTIKTRLQARKQNATAAPQAAAAASTTSAASAAPSVASVTASPRPFYRGLLSAMLGSFPAAATFWLTYEAGKRHLTPLVGDGPWGFLAHAGSAGLADVAVCAVRNPFEVVKQQMQLGLHADTRSALRTILAVDGVRGLYAGYGSTVLREIPFDAIEFGLYEAMKGRLRRRKGAEAEEARRDAAAAAAGGGQPTAALSTDAPVLLLPDLVLWENCLLGSIAGGVAAAVTTPLDVVKTRLMTQTRTAAADRYAGWSDAFRRITAEEGGAALFSGIRPRVAWISVGGAIFIGSYEEAKRRLA